MIAPRVSSTFVLSAAALASLAACQPLAPRADEEAPPALDERFAPVTGALATGDLEGARAALDDIEFADELAQARAVLADGDPRDALVHVDRALDLHPDDAEALELKARGATAVADRMIAEGAGAVYIEGALFDALAAWRSLPGTPENKLSASEVAYRLSDFALARRLGREAKDELPAGDMAQAERAHRAWAEAAFQLFVASVQDGVTGDTLNEQYLQAEDALLETIGMAPDDVQLRVRLVDLYLWASAAPQAVEVAKAALQRLPGERELLDRMLTAGATLADLETLDPGAPLHQYYIGRARLRTAIATQQDAPAEANEAARTAAKELRAAAEAAPELAEEILGWRVIARTTQGWAQYWGGKLEPAQALFESVEKLMVGGSAWRIEGEVLSAIDGLFYIGDQHRQAGDWERAARVFQALERLQPGDSNWANNAGFFARDAAVELEAEGRDMCLLASGGLADDRRVEELRALAGLPETAGDAQVERELLIHESASRFERARALAEESYASYKHAAELEPTDVRIVNDTALIQVYYLHAELDAARSYLERAIELGEAQLAAIDAGTAELDEDSLFALTEAYGDALQNMGVLHMMLLDDAAGALPYLEASRDVGPIPRPLITNALIPWALGELEVPLEAVLPEVNWCAPCATNR